MSHLVKSQNSMSASIPAALTEQIHQMIPNVMQLMAELPDWRSDWLEDGFEVGNENEVQAAYLQNARQTYYAQIQPYVTSAKNLIIQYFQIVEQFPPEIYEQLSPIECNPDVFVQFEHCTTQDENWLETMMNMADELENVLYDLNDALLESIEVLIILNN